MLKSLTVGALLLLLDHCAHTESRHLLQSQHPQGAPAWGCVLVQGAPAQQNQPGQPGVCGAAAVRGGERGGAAARVLCHSQQGPGAASGTIVQTYAEVSLCSPGGGLHVNCRDRDCSWCRARQAMWTKQQHPRGLFALHTCPACLPAAAGRHTGMWARCRTCTCQQTPWRRWPTWRLRCLACTATRRSAWWV